MENCEACLTVAFPGRLEHQCTKTEHSGHGVEGLGWTHKWSPSINQGQRPKVTLRTISETALFTIMRHLFSNAVYFTDSFAEICITLPLLDFIF